MVYQLLMINGCKKWLELWVNGNAWRRTFSMTNTAWASLGLKLGDSNEQPATVCQNSDKETYK
jgi:hypothetical protein